MCGFYTGRWSSAQNRAALRKFLPTPETEGPPTHNPFQRKEACENPGCCPIPAASSEHSGCPGWALRGRPSPARGGLAQCGKSRRLSPWGKGCQTLSSEQCAPGGCPQRAGTRRPDAPSLPHVHSALSQGRAQGPTAGKPGSREAWKPPAVCRGPARRGGAELSESPLGGAGERLGQCSCPPPPACPSIRAPLPAPHCHTREHTQVIAEGTPAGPWPTVTRNRSEMHSDHAADLRAEPRRPRAARQAHRGPRWGNPPAVPKQTSCC